MAETSRLRDIDVSGTERGEGGGSRVKLLGKFSVVYEGRRSQQSLMIRGTLRNRGRKKLLCTGLGSTFQL